jgi:hypothetical protein
MGYTEKPMREDSLPELPEAEVEVRHYAGVLRQAVRTAGLSVTEVERRLGVGPKSLRRVFGGQVDLKFKHVVAVLRVIGMSQEEFFTLAIRRRQRSRAGGFLAAFRSAGYRGNFEPIPEDVEPPLTAEEFDRQVEEAVQRVLIRRAEEGKPLLLDGPPPATTPPPGDKPPLADRPPSAKDRLQGEQKDGQD